MTEGLSQERPEQQTTDGPPRPVQSGTACNRGQCGCRGWQYAGRVMRISHADTGDRLASIERMIEHYRLETIRRQERRAMTLWQKIETRQKLADFEKPLDRIH